MRKPVKTHLPAVSSPLEWATTADGILYTAQIPNREDGSIETGDIRAQAALTLSNLRRTVEAAGGGMGAAARVPALELPGGHIGPVERLLARMPARPLAQPILRLENAFRPRHRFPPSSSRAGVTSNDGWPSREKGRTLA